MWHNACGCIVTAGLLSLSLSPLSPWQTVVLGSVLTLRFLFDPPVMPSLTWQRAKNISSEFCLPIFMETASHQSQLEPSRLCNSKVCFCPFVVFMIVSFYHSFNIFTFAFFLVFRCAICPRSGDCYQGNKHLSAHPVGSSKGTQQSDWLLHRPVCEGVQGLDLGQSQTSQERQVCFEPNINVSCFNCRLFCTKDADVIVFLQVCG